MILPLLLAIALPAGGVPDARPLETVVVQEGGRKKPLLVMAEESARGLTGKRAVVVDGQRLSALDLVVALWLSPEGWAEKPLVLVGNVPLKRACGLDTARKLFSYAELTGNDALRRLLSEAAAERARPGSPRLTGLPKEAADVGLRLAELEALADGSAFRVVATADSPAWSTASATQLAPLREAYRAGDPAAFATAASRFAAGLAGIEPAHRPPDRMITLETLYQKAHPIRWAWVCYLAAGLALALAGRTRAGYAAGWGFALAGFALQVAGFAARVAISGRPPVTNMYETVLWVAFGTVFFALVFEAIYRSRVILLAACPVAIISLLLADSQPATLDRAINPLVPVLRDNFWLTTHVLTITLSYAAFALALALGHAILWSVIRRRSFSPALANYLYRLLQVGVLLLASGTILGGVWANYSWGRFWDWDPKEVWALVTLLAYLFVLHGRIAGKWGGFGLAVGSVLCFLSVLMAWYGVNFVLGTGLHSYGFGSGGYHLALSFVIAELLFVAVALWHRRSPPPSRPAAPIEAQASTPHGS